MAPLENVSFLFEIENLLRTQLTNIWQDYFACSNIAVAFLGEKQQSRQAWEVEALGARNFNNSLLRFRFREKN